MIRPQAGTAAAARPDRRSTLMHVLAAAVLLSMATHADAYVIKTWAANGVYDATELECRLAPPPPLPEGCFGIPFTAQLEYIDARPGQDDQIGIGQVGLLRFIDRSQSLSFEYTPTGALPPLLRPADLLAVLVQEQGDAIVFSASVRRAGSPATLWTFETNGAFHMDNGHGEGGVGSAGAVQWQLLRSTDVPEPGSLVLVGLALASIGIQRRAWAANRGW